MLTGPSETILQPDAYLGVRQSLTGKRWRQRQGDDRLGLAFAQRLGVPEVVGRLMAGRGIDLESAERYLSPTLRDFLPDPSRLKDMDRAAERLARAVMQAETIAVFGDYDVDGATSTALLVRFLAALGSAPLIYIPDRRREGYGPNTAALLKLQAAGARIVVTVDCGTTAHEPLQAAHDAGLDVVVIDHHAAEPALPTAYAVVNPNRLDDDSGEGTLAAVGVTFLLLVALNRTLRAEGYYARVPQPDLLQWLDLVALGTVCDVVPLTGLNRALVAQGLKIAAGRRNPGLAALADGASVSERLDAYHLGYVLGPRVNAGGRVGRADLGSRLLSTDDAGEARGIALELEAFNAERRQIEATVLAEAIAQVDAAAAGNEAGPVVIAEGRDWHAGVIGIVAARLKERYNRPACVITWEDGTGKGSGRSIPSVDLGAAIIAARQAGLLLGGGGHRMAAGFSLTPDALQPFARFLGTRIGAEADGDLTPELGIDGMLAPGAATPDLLGVLAGLGPFGAGNAEPRFVLPRLRVVKADVVGQNHVRCILTGGGSERLKAIAFRALETPLGPALLQSAGAALHIAGYLRADNWQGRTGIQLMIDDAAFAQSS